MKKHRNYLVYALLLVWVAYVLSIMLPIAFAHPQSECSGLVCDYEMVEDRNGRMRSVLVCE